MRHARMTLASLAIVCLLVAALSTTALAALGEVTISDHDDGFASGSFVALPSPWRPNPGGGCQSGFHEDFGDMRFAIEFPLSRLPADATVISATLSLFLVNFPTGGGPVAQHAIYGYAGDGSIDPADVEVTGSPVLHTPTTDQPVEHDVTALLTPEVIAAGWAGFSVRQEPFITDLLPFIALWNCDSVTDLTPLLIIAYSVPDPTPTPRLAPALRPAARASPTPTPTASAAALELPDTATPSGAWTASIAVLTVVAVMGLVAARRSWKPDKPPVIDAH